MCVKTATGGELHELEIPAEGVEMEKSPLEGGGFGQVYKARRGNESVAVKVIKVGSEQESHKVWSEAKITYRLNHPNVIKLIGITTLKPMKKYGIVMELAEHGSLDRWIGKIDHDQAVKIALVL